MTCGKEPDQCSYCYGFTCPGCAIPWGGKYRCCHCQRPFEEDEKK